MRRAMAWDMKTLLIGAALAVAIGAGIGAALAQSTTAVALPAPVTDADYRPLGFQDAGLQDAGLQEARLGQALFYDPVLSGNRSVACATCHHPAFGTSDGVSLAFGDGGTGLGPERVVDPENPPEQRIPRNAPALFNLGAHEFTVLFHDGRIEVDPARPSGLRTPLGDDMSQGFASLLSAQTMFPVLSPDEMAGHYNENDVARAVRQGLITGEGGAWDIIARRVADIPTYAQDFAAVYPHIDTPQDIRFTDISDAIAVFMEHEWRSDSSPFDAYLRGTGDLPADARAGMALFYGEAGCASCHSGPFQTDHGFHAMGAPQLGPGKAARFESHARDTGRMRVTGQAGDAYAFRTPSLRNVALTGPWGHAGGHDTLESFLRHHADPATPYERNAVLPAFETGGGAGADDWRILDTPQEAAAIARAVRTPPVTLDDAAIAALLAFLHSLTDPVAETGRLGIPASVPSGLEVPEL